LPPLCVAIQLLPGSAAACSLCSCETPRGFRPAVDTIAEVPLNARFLVELTDFRPDEEPRTLDASDIRWTNLVSEYPVPFDVVDTDGSAGQVWLVPTELLPPNTEFTLEVGPEGDQPVFRNQFRTGIAVDDAPPAAAAPQVELDNPSGACGAFQGALLTWDAIDDNGSRIGYEPVVELLVTQGSQSVVLFQDALFLGSRKGVQLAAPTDDASAACWASSAIPFYSPGQRYKVTPSIYDRAGNRTQLEPLTLTLERNPGAYCSNDEGDCSLAPLGDPHRRTLWPPLLLAPVVGLLRRRRESCPTGH
jgi:hypothetical protein